MSELVREIEQGDIPKLKELARTVFGKDCWKDIERLGGMTNHSYRITLEDGRQYLFRIPGEGTEEMINRSDERKSTELACKLDIDAPLLFFSDDGRKVMEFIRDPQPMDEHVMMQKDNIRQAADIFHRLHTCGVDTGVRFEVFEMAQLYERIIRDGGVRLYDDYDKVKSDVMEIKQSMDRKFGIVRVPCHNDSLVGNWVLSGTGRLYLIDWEYSGMNDPMWDLSCLSIEIGYTKKHEDMLLEFYLGRKATIDEKRRFVAAKTYVDLLWTLWGLTRVPYDGAFMQEYADGRYARLKKSIESYRALV